MDENNGTVALGGEDEANDAISDRVDPSCPMINCSLDQAQLSPLKWRWRIKQQLGNNRHTIIVVLTIRYLRSLFWKGERGGESEGRTSNCEHLRDHFDDH